MTIHFYRWRSTPTVTSNSVLDVTEAVDQTSSHPVLSQEASQVWKQKCLRTSPLHDDIDGIIYSFTYSLFLHNRVALDNKYNFWYNFNLKTYIKKNAFQFENCRCLCLFWEILEVIISKCAWALPVTFINHLSASTTLLCTLDLDFALLSPEEDLALCRLLKMTSQNNTEVKNNHYRPYCIQLYGFRLWIPSLK